MADETSGILVVDKPASLTSAQVVARVKRMTRAKKVGHTGTLDPFATGVMVCCLNRATRLAAFFLHGDKAYDAVMTLGARTDTQDATGTVLSGDPDAAGRLTETEIWNALAQFQGEIDQVPPVYSALKHEGVPLYRLARSGRAVEKPARRVRIDEITVESITGAEVRFSVACSAGTYLRTLCHDVGEILGCGAHLKALRRTRSGGFSIDEAAPLEQLRKLADRGTMGERIIPMTEALRDMPSHRADAALTAKIGYGTPLAAADIPPTGASGPVKVIGADHRLLAVVQPKAGGRYDYCCVFYP